MPRAAGDHCRAKAGTEWDELSYHSERHTFAYPCGTCGAAIGERCIRVRGSRRPYQNTVHKGRYPSWPQHGANGDTPTR